MKVVINKCFGGFGLSEEAIRALHAAGDPHIRAWEPREWYGGATNWAQRFEQDQKRTGMFKLILDGGKILASEHADHDSARSCPQLVAVVEEMGAKANGRHAKLAVVEIPDGISFEISDYDGQETVEESHRSWR